MSADILKKNPSKISKYPDFSHNNCNKCYNIELKETDVLVISHKISHFSRNPKRELFYLSILVFLQIVNFP